MHKSIQQLLDESERLKEKSNGYIAGYIDGIRDAIKALERSTYGRTDNTRPTAYPQEQENNEYRYISPAWLNEVSKGLTAGAAKHPGETWRSIPADEHLARAMRHINLYRMGDRSEPHIINASMRIMMAFEMETDDDK